MNWEGSSARHRFTFINSFFMQLTKKTYSFNGNFNHTCHIVLIIIEGAHIHKEKYNWDPSLGLRAIYICLHHKLLKTHVCIGSHAETSADVTGTRNDRAPTLILITHVMLF